MCTRNVYGYALRVITTVFVCSWWPCILNKFVRCNNFYELTSVANSAKSGNEPDFRASPSSALLLALLPASPVRFGLVPVAHGALWFATDFFNCAGRNYWSMQSSNGFLLLLPFFFILLFISRWVRQLKRWASLSPRLVLNELQIMRTACKSTLIICITINKAITPDDRTDIDCLVSSSVQNLIY